MENKLGGLAFFGFIQFTLIVFRISGLIEWDWIIVMLPTWFPLLAITVTLLLIAVWSIYSAWGIEDLPKCSCAPTQKQKSCDSMYCQNAPWN